ncbi:MAG: CDP-glycerol glycerophosphotransferase family protein [Thermodesulfobacteriota bacterium]
MSTQKKRVLFTGYAQVHFVCFLPVYKLLAADPDVEVFLSGGFKRKVADGVEYDLAGFYDPYPVDKDHVISLERVRSESFDVLVSAHLSDTLFPKSVGKKVQIFHGVSVKNLAIREKALRYDMLCLPGRYHAEQYRDNGLVRDGVALCLVTGFPKVDSLVGGALNKEALLRGMGLDPALPTILFAPTGEKHNALDTMGKEVVEALGKAGQWNLLVKPHDHPKKDIDWFTELASYEGKTMRLVKERDIIPYLYAADLLLTDMSSVAVEYTLLDRPIVFLHIPKLMKRIKKRSPALDLDTYGTKIGSVVSDIAALIPVISESLSSPAKEGELRRAMAAHLFHDPGHAAINVAGVVRYAAGLTATLPSGVEVLNA